MIGPGEGIGQEEFALLKYSVVHQFELPPPLKKGLFGFTGT